MKVKSFPCSRTKIKHILHRIYLKMLDYSVSKDISTYPNVLWDIIFQHRPETKNPVSHIYSSVRLGKNILLLYVFFKFSL